MARVPASALVPASPPPGFLPMEAEVSLARLIVHHSWRYSTDCCASCQWLSLPVLPRHALFALRLLPSVAPTRSTPPIRIKLRKDEVRGSGRWSLPRERLL